MIKPSIEYYKRFGRTPQMAIAHFSEEDIDGMPIEYGYGEGGKETFERIKKRAGNSAASWDYNDFSKYQHHKSFTVAKSTVADVLDDIAKELLEYQKGGKTPKDFIDNLVPILQEKGWWGKRVAINPNTGKEELVQLGSIGRLKNILMTNIKVSNAHGRYIQQMRTADSRPYLRYQQLDRENQREEHKQYHNMVFRADDPDVWMIYPPNGFGCGCKMVSMTERQFKKLGLEVTKIKDIEEDITDQMRDFDPRTEWHPDLKKLLPQIGKELEKVLAEDTPDIGYTMKTEEKIKKSKVYKSIDKPSSPILNKVEEAALRIWDESDDDNEVKAAAGKAILRLPYSGSTKVWSYSPIGIKGEVGSNIKVGSHIKAVSQQYTTDGWEIVIRNPRGKDVELFGFLYDILLPSYREYKLISRDADNRIIVLEAL